MNALDKELNYYSGYFNGIQDIYNHKSCKEVGKGILKLVSLITVIAPSTLYNYEMRNEEIDVLLNCA